MSDYSIPSQLVDRFGRNVTYLRVSVTDRCDFRCQYCMAEEMTFLPRAQILTLEEIYFICRAFTELGVTKIRITGGEPLVRKNVPSLLRQLGRLHSLRELVMTTNASRLAQMAGQIRAAGVRRINVSLDTLDREKFRAITRTGDLGRVLQGIEAARQAGFERIKINSVILKNRNHDEVNQLVEYAIGQNLDISFIEEMPLGMIDSHDRGIMYYSSDRIKQDLASQFTLLPLLESTGGPSVYYRVQGTGTRVGFISPHSANFCASCNRVRLTAEGRLLLCLGNEHSVDLKKVVRAHPGNMPVLKQAIVAAMRIKPEKHEFNIHEQPVILRHMNATGG